MVKIDASKIKEMTNDLVTYGIYEKEEKMRKTKLKNIFYGFLAIGILTTLGTLSVNALTDKAVSKAIKDDLQVKVNDTSYAAKCSEAKDGKIICTLDENIIIDSQPESEAGKEHDVTLDDNLNK